jgi:transcription antitermination factor NusG
LIVKNQQELIDDLKKIHKARNVSLPMQEVPFVETGYLVKITAGALIGLTGIVENIENPERFIIRVNVISKDVSIALKPSQFKIMSEKEYE